MLSVGRSNRSASCWLLQEEQMTVEGQGRTMRITRHHDRMCNQKQQGPKMLKGRMTSVLCQSD